MIITEVNSFVDLVKKATNFAFQLQDGWYKGSAEVERFQDHVLMLSEKHDQWSVQLRRHGLSEDKRLLLAVQLALQVLEKQQQYVTRLQKNPLMRLRKKAFPAQLSYSLNRVSEIVDAGPQLLANRVATHDLLGKSGVQTPAPLPFVSDPNYVPISKSVKEIQDALERPEGIRVVTLYGEPGLGKSSVVKFIALHYAEQRKKLLNGTLSESPTFPDGVYYLFCGQEAKGRVNELQRELTNCLGFGASSSVPKNDSTAPGGQGGQSFQQILPEMKLRSRLVEQKLLIILDDLWEGEVLQQLLVPADGVKYLITSQMREIWGTAEKIQLEKPTLSEARHIMANYTDGLPNKGEFPKNIKGVTDQIIWKLAYHPLSLANVGIGINRSRVSDASHWKAISDNFHVLLDKNDLQGRPVVYDRRYNLTVGESMMCMVESLLPQPRKLLFLIALLEGQQLRETLVRYFYKFLQDVQIDGFLLTYNCEEKYLEDRSLVTLHTRGPNDTTLTAHNLRTHYIREKKALDLQSIASQIVPRSDQGLKLIEGGDAEETLLTVLRVMYYRRPFTNVVVNALRRHVQIINDGVVPRSINDGTDLIELVKGKQRQVDGLLFLLNVDVGEPDWKQQAHGYARKIIIKLVCQGRLDDHSMACLLQLPQITEKACEALQSIYRLLHFFEFDFLNQQEPFSRAHPETTNALLALVYDSATWTTFPYFITRLLWNVLDTERKETIVEVGTEWMELLAIDSNPTFQIAIAKALLERRNVGRSVAIMCEFTDILEVLMGLLVSGKDYKVRESAGKTLAWFCEWEDTALKIARIPDVLPKLFSLFLSINTCHEGAGVILEKLLREPENRHKFQVNNGVLQDLGDILAKVEGIWRAAHQRKDRVMLEEQASIAAGILSELALEEDVKESIVPLPGVEEGLLFLQATDVAKLLLHDYYPSDGIRYLYRIDHTRSTRALTILFSNPADPRGRGVPSIGDLEVFIPDAGLLSKTSCVADGYLLVNPIVSLAQMLMHLEMGAYRAALQSLDMAQHHLDQLLEGRPRFKRQILFNGTLRLLLSSYTTANGSISFFLPISYIRMFLQAMLEDQAGALLAANTILEHSELNGPGVGRSAIRKAEDEIVLVERGIIKRLCGDYQGALDDLNLASIRAGDPPSNYLCDKYDILKHRGYVKHLMTDEAGAREDAEAAEAAEAAHRLRSGCRVMRRSRTFDSLWKLQKQPVNYLGYFLK